MKTKSRIIILAQSGILPDLVPTLWGGAEGFATVGEAELCGAQNIKTLKWRVATEVTRTPLRGEVEVNYEFKSPVYDPRAGDSPLLRELARE
jgi:hypothetical protein